MPLEFNENKAIEAIKSRLPEGVEYDDDEILNVIDIIFDYYEENGLLDIDCDADDVDEDKMIYDLYAYVAKMLKKDPYSLIKSEHIETIVAAELEYERSIGFDD